MIEEVGERILIDGKVLDLHSYPLEKFWNENNRKPSYPKHKHFSDHRGYAATWELENGKLYLIEVEGFINKFDIFPKAEGKIHAKWFSGKLKIPQGDILEFNQRQTNDFYGKIFEREWAFEIFEGVTINDEIIDNRLYYGSNSYPRVITSKGFEKFKVRKDLFEICTDSGEISFNSFIILFQEIKTIVINGTKYHIDGNKNWLVRDDIITQIPRLEKRGMFYYEALELLKYEDVPETKFDVIYELIINLNVKQSWINRVQAINEFIKIVINNNEVLFSNSWNFKIFEPLNQQEKLFYGQDEKAPRIITSKGF